MSEHLFLFSITPVQAYIEQARKTQDLYAGSQILSLLCRTAIKTTLAEANITATQIIFPKFDSNVSGYCLPNRFLAKFDAEEQTLKSLGKTVADAVRDEFRQIAKAVIKEHTKREHLSDIERKQIETYLTINWVFVPVNGDYKTAYEQIERYLGAIKQVRTFAQLEETGRKCAICGERNVKFYHKTEQEGTNSTPPNKLFITHPNEVKVWGFGDIKCNPKWLQPGEGLCAVCFAKRGAEAYFENVSNYDADFDSTAHIALLDAIENLPESDRNEWNKKKFDAHLIFDWKNKNDKNIVQAEKLAKKHIRFKEEFENAQKLQKLLATNEIAISPYYAMLRFDGDSMGKWLAGNFLKNADAETLKKFHPHFSAELAMFAKHVAGYFDANPSKGRAVYIGGDDFLGFLSLNSMFMVMKELRELFDKLNIKDFSDYKPTFSAGLVVAHYKTPLSEVLKWSHTTEKAAKDVNEEKDRFSIAVLKHSGEIQKTVFKWKDQEKWTTDIFNQIIVRIGDKEFSGTFLNSLDMEFRKLMNQDGTFSEPTLIKTEIKRLVERSCQIDRQEHEKREKALQDMTRDVTALFESYSIAENFLSALGIIDFLTRKVTT